METRYLNTLVEVLQNGSFSKAAEILYITQSAVSQRIKFMEEQYGVPLIDRSGNTITATDAGRAVLENAQKILRLEKELSVTLQDLKTESKISVGCTPTFGTQYLPRILRMFLKDDSDKIKIKTHVNSPENILKRVLNNEDDVAVVEHCFGINSPQIITINLPQDEMALVSAPISGLPPGSISIATLLKQRLIARRDGCSSRGLLENNLAKYGKKLDDFRSVVIHDDLNISIQNMLSGLGVGFVSKSLVQEYLDDGRLREHIVEGFTNFRLRTIVLNLKHRESKNIDNFVKCVDDLLEATSHADPDQLP